MMRVRFNEERIISILKEAEAGRPSPSCAGAARSRTRRSTLGATSTVGLRSSSCVACGTWQKRTDG
jgi:hypothetical protein